MDVKLVRDGLKRKKAERLYNPDYIRFRSSFRGVERGTVIIEKRIVWGFPHIKRIFTLENGLKKNMPGTMLHAEEKIDGFNVRIASVAGEVCAFSRGGFLDLFVTEKAREMGLEGFFKEHPDYVLCGEMLGNTPYTKPTKDFDVRLFVFDIDRGDGSYLPCEEKYALLKRHSIDHVPVLGKFRSDDYKKLRNLALSLNKGRKEGMVLKSADRRHVVKYVTPFADIDDISKTSTMLFDMPIGFYYQRILRSAFFINDFGFDRDRYSARLGKAFYDGLSKALNAAAHGHEIEEEFEILIKDKAVWDDVRRHMSRDVGLEELWRHQEKGKTRIRFRKIYKKTTKKLSAYAAGKGITD